MLIIPQKYKLKLLPETTQVAIKQIKDTFQIAIAEALDLRRVTAPLFVLSGTGINDDLNGVEPPVNFQIPAINGRRAEVVHSLAKWKRMKLAEYDIAPGFGLYTDMNAIRTTEELDNIHSLYVDQWDWEKTIRPEDRTVEFLYDTVRRIYVAIRATEREIYRRYPHITPTLPEHIYFITAEELLQRYPELSPKERERKIAREMGAVFIRGIGGRLSDGEKHDGRAADYDDWTTDGGLNGDIIVWNQVLEIPFELSSMGIRVDRTALLKQLEIEGKQHYAERDFHKALLAGELPESIGGGIGQSRLCMLLLQKAHIGEVQSSLWPDEQVEALAAAGITLL
ncbi:MAG: aspartate--ammonia ligase [Bacteroides sp.]|nr:aspartate--ammonia ligase [Bacteroides sp.]MCM1380217.1 aspartate--ammonia ligase [Bacteroides sp.]MCM1446524.1 aspartate--ammonia ligase [Prevotella sp.]